MLDGFLSSKSHQNYHKEVSLETSPWIFQPYSSQLSHKSEGRMQKQEQFYEPAVYRTAQW